jgi:hypothetical protein
MVHQPVGHIKMKQIQCTMRVEWHGRELSAWISLRLRLGLAFENFDQNNQSNDEEDVKASITETVDNRGNTLDRSEGSIEGRSLDRSSRSGGSGGGSTFSRMVDGCIRRRAVDDRRRRTGCGSNSRRGVGLGKNACLFFFVSIQQVLNQETETQFGQTP